MRSKRFSFGRTTTFPISVLPIFVVLIFVVMLAAPGVRAVAQETVLHSFENNGKDGMYSYASLIFDGSGNLYGTTQLGGAHNSGAVFELIPPTPPAARWTEKILHSFNLNGKDGSEPYASLILDGAGNLFGTTAGGGAHDSGTVFELIPPTPPATFWTEKILHSFLSYPTDGVLPYGSLVLDGSGNLYGTTNEGGSFSRGTVFEVSPVAGGTWTERLLHSFDDNGTDGFAPRCALIFDGDGNLYGTTTGGGPTLVGTVFELTPVSGGSWKEKILHGFDNNGDGFQPYTGVTLNAGNLYGTTLQGGFEGYGTVFELAPAGAGTWTESILYSFENASGKGIEPYASVIFDAAGNMYGTTGVGGLDGGSGYGVVFELSQLGGGWTYKTLHVFGRGKDGQYPQGGNGLVSDSAGNLYSTTAGGGFYSSGTVFEITP
jgi:uncharacterized repeat protein (TIGR03803 family)